MNRLLTLSAWLLAACPKPAFIHPEAERHNALCVQLMTQGQLVDARTHCEHAREFTPDYPEALVNLALLEKLEGHLDKAREHLIHAIRLNNEMAQAYNDLCVLDFEAQDFSKAETRCRRALEVNPDYLEARYNLALVQAAQKKYDEAEKSLRHLLATNASISKAHLGLGRLMLLRGRPTDAVAFLERATLLTPGDAATWNTLGLAREQLGNFAGAAEAFDSCVDADPKDLECKEGLSRVNTKKGH